MFGSFVDWLLALLIHWLFFFSHYLCVCLFSACFVSGPWHTIFLIFEIGLKGVVIDNPSPDSAFFPSSVPALLSIRDEEIERWSDCQSPTARKLYNQLSSPIPCSFQTNWSILLSPCQQWVVLRGWLGNWDYWKGRGCRNSSWLTTSGKESVKDEGLMDENSLRGLKISVVLTMAEMTLKE